MPLITESCLHNSAQSLHCLTKNLKLFQHLGDGLFGGGGHFVCGGGQHGIEPFPIVIVAYRKAYLDGQQLGNGLVRHAGLPWHSLRGQSYCSPLRRIQSQEDIRIPPLSSLLLHGLTCKDD